ncbi:MAG: hypothetical protein ACREB3_00600, partial [Burkholderiales bacterium]
MVAITNRATVPLALDSAELIDVLGNPQTPGDDPWKLEARSKANHEKYKELGLNIALGAGTVAIYAGAAAGATVSAATGATATALAVVPIIAVVDILAVAVMNNNNKAKVQEEFDRRRLRLPLTLAPGATADGSLFFPTTPGPQRLILRGTSAGQPCEVVLDLKPLAGLHLKKG